MHMNNITWIQFEYKTMTQKTPKSTYEIEAKEDLHISFSVLYSNICANSVSGEHALEHIPVHPDY